MLKLVILLLISSITLSFQLSTVDHGTLEMSNPSFLNIFPYNNQDALWITQFSAKLLSSGALYVVEDLSKDFSTSEAKLVCNGFLWPNYPSPVPESLGLGEAVIVPDGFLVPTKTTGAIYIVQLEGDSFGTKTKISKHKSNFFYHFTTWIDVNGDGREDLLTARATKPMIGSSYGELLWLEQPKSNILTTWEEHVLCKGPDVNFVVRSIDDTSFEVFAAEFFSEKVEHIVISNATVVSQTIIDDNSGAAYSMQLIDVNGDGIDDLLSSNHEATNGEVFVYEGPNFTEKYKIGSDYKVIAKGINQAAPGFAYGIYPTGSTGSAPYVLVAGDGSEDVTLLSPADRYTFNYTKSTVQQYEGVIGSLAIKDLDGDSALEFIVANYDDGFLQMFSFSD